MRTNNSSMLNKKIPFEKIEKISKRAKFMWYLFLEKKLIYFLDPVRTKILISLC